MGSDDDARRDFNTARQYASGAGTTPANVVADLTDLMLRLIEATSVGTRLDRLPALRGEIGYLQGQVTGSLSKLLHDAAQGRT